MEFTHSNTECYDVNKFYFTVEMADTMYQIINTKYEKEDIHYVKNILQFNI